MSIRIVVTPWGERGIMANEKSTRAPVTVEKPSFKPTALALAVAVACRSKLA